MIVNFEFLDEESIENVITCLHYKVDKVIFFGYKERISEKEKSIRDFLKKHCGIRLENIVFYEISDRDLQAVLAKMREKILEERNAGNMCFFDVTGGEGLALLAFGMLSREFLVPMHMYDVEKDELLEFDKDYTERISKNVPNHHIRLNLDKFIEMQGGVISYKHNKGYKGRHSQSDLQDIKKLWKVNQCYEKEWNQFTMFLARYAQSMMVNLSADIVTADIKNRNSIQTTKKLNQILDTCAKEGLLRDVKHEKGQYSFVYKNEFVKACLCDGGSILEQYTYLLEIQKAPNADCRVGVHIDWDGIIHEEWGKDVLNEIDVLTLDGNVPVFISCKGGKVDQNALYELDAVASRFGGKYVKKVLVMSRELAGGHALRAKEMGIEIRVL